VSQFVWDVHFSCFVLTFIQKKGIFCLNSKRIAIAGKIRVFCFDKTGTLTNSGLDFIGVRDVRKDKENHPIFGPVQSPLCHDESIDNVILHGLATCHAVSKFGEQFVGNEVEVLDLSSGFPTGQQLIFGKKSMLL
jgi:magnesium-transporting ATPase (P-type)